MSIPEEYGGEAAHSRTKPSYSKSKPESGDSSWGAGLHSGIVAHYILQYAAEELRRQWLPKRWPQAK